MRLHIPCTLRLSDHRVNVDVGPAQEKMLITGLHSICDVHCTTCRAYLGWRYVSWTLAKLVVLPSLRLVRSPTQKQEVCRDPLTQDTPLLCCSLVPLVERKWRLSKSKSTKSAR